MEVFSRSDNMSETGKQHFNNAMKTIIKKTRPLLLVLCAAVVFVTTYLLILPAVTLEEQEAAKQGGIDLPAASQQATDVTEAKGEDSEPADAEVNAEAEDAEPAEPADGMLSFDGDGYAVQAAYDAKAGLPEDTELAAVEIGKDDDGYQGWYDEALKAVQDSKGGEQVTGLKFAKFYDISLLAGDEAIEPEAPVNVSISYDKALKAADADHVRIVHFGTDEEGELVPEVLDPKDVELELKKGKMSGTAFAAESFSVYGIVYTVDFHWEVDGKKFDFSIPGGGFVSFTDLVKELEIAEDDPAAFVENVEKMEFSDPDLVWVGKAEEETTVGALKEENGLECEYSADMTEEAIEEINAQTVQAGDWTLISVRSFTTEEKLTITMKNGDQFVIKVTDAQDPSIFDGKEVIIYNNTAQRAMTSGGYDYGGHRLNSIPMSEADSDSSAHWKVESTNGGYYLRNNGRYLRLESNSATVVSNQNQATVFYIEAGRNPDYRIQDSNNRSNILTYSTNPGWDPYFSGQGNISGTTQQWLYIREVQNYSDRAGDWLLYFNDDFDEITIHVGETVSLRPYNKWEWKEDDIDVQTAHWIIGGKDNSYWNQIDASDANGAHQDSWDDGGTGGTAGFHWTAYVKEDSQLDTHYWAVQGQATQTGDYVLTNTKNNKTITVHVVDGAPKPPNTINNIANIKVNLFDYDNGGALDVGLNGNGEANHNLANDNNYKDESVNEMGGSDHFYFLSSGSGNNNNESWNSYTRDQANPGIVKDTLDDAGYPVLNHGNNTSLQYLFDTSEASQSWHGGSGGNGMIAYPNVVGMFQKDSEGYYYYNSNTNFFYYDTATGTSKLYEHTYTQNSGADKGALANDKPIGFFPFHEYNSTDDLYVNQNADLNHHVGMSMDVEFMLPKNKYLDDEGTKPIIFDFSGDDDLWVFVEWIDDNGEKHSRLLLDLGGVHQPISGHINFTDGTSTSGVDVSFIKPNHPYTLKVFYLERGGCDSNCSIRFNLPIIQDLAVAKKLTGLTEAEKEKYKNEEFEYEILVNGELYDSDHRVNKFEKVTIWNAAGEDVTPADFKIENGRFKLKAGQTLTITYLDRSDQFTVAELNTKNMENFEVPNAERYYHLPQDASMYEEEIQLTPSQTVSEPKIGDWVTPEYTLEDTEKVTFTNTLKEKNLEVEKKWAGEQAHPDSITFKVIATVDDGEGGRTPYAVNELKESDGTTDKVFTLNNANDWRHEIEHLPVNTPDGKFIFYDIVESQVDGYVLTGLEDITADRYNYCNVDVVKLWPDSNGTHTEVLQVVLKNSEGKYYAGVDEETGEAKFVDDLSGAEIRQLKPAEDPEDSYSQRYARLPYDDYTAVQLHEDEYNRGLATFRRAIIQYELENTPLEGPADPEPEDVTPEIHKRIDALRDGVANPDSAHTDEDLTDLYRLYLDYKIDSLQEPDGVDLLFVIDHSGSMNSSDWPGNEYRAPSVMTALNGQNGLIAEFLAANDKNRWAAVGFKGPDGSRDYTWSLKNPWEPETAAAKNNAGQNGSEVLSSGNTFTRQTANIDLDDEGASILSNYTAGFWRAEQFLLDSTVQADGRKKVVVFITDGVPTLHIDDLNGSLQGAGTAAGSKYYHEEYGGCPDKALTEFDCFVNDMTSNGYSFGGNAGNIEFYTIGLGAQMQTAGGADLLNGMLSAAYGQTVPANHFMTITDASGSSDSSAANKLGQDLRIVLGLNHTFSDLVIKDNLSKYVDLYGLAGAGSSASDIMAVAKAKVTMTVPDSENPQNPPQVITLYENGAPATAENAKFTKANGTKATIIQELLYDASTKTVSAVFDPEYQPAGDVTYTLSFDVKATDEAYDTYADTGYDKYPDGDHQGQIIVGDQDTDFLGTDPANATSVDKEGFRSNDEAKATYDHNNEDEELVYPHPVIQVSAKADIVKVDQTGAALEGAKFNLYDENYDPSKTIEQNAGSLIEADLQSKKPTDPPGEDAVIRSGKLTVGTYYLVETNAPAGYNSLTKPVKITVTETNGILQMEAWIEGASAGDKLVKVSDYGVWKLSIPNSTGVELPHSGGPGTTWIYLIGSILLICCSTLLVARRRVRKMS